MKKSILKLIAIAGIAIGLSACGQVIDVPNAHVGKIKQPSGMSEGVLVPSTGRLNVCFIEPCPSLVLLENPDYEFKEALDFVVPEDKLKLSVDIRGRLRLRDKDAYDFVFSRVISQATNVSGVTLISFDKVYIKYARDIIRNVVRAKLSENNIATNMANREILSAQLLEAVEKELKSTPITLSYIGIAKMDPPEVILNAEIKAKQREIAIKEARSQKQIDLEKASAREEVARKNQAADLVEAETQVLVAKKLAQGVSKAWIAQRGLKILEEMSKGNNKIILLPMEAITNPSIMMGVNNNAMRESHTAAKTASSSK